MYMKWHQEEEVVLPKKHLPPYNIGPHMTEKPIHTCHKTSSSTKKWGPTETCEPINICHMETMSPIEAPPARRNDFGVEPKITESGKGFTEKAPYTEKKDVAKTKDISH